MQRKYDSEQVGWFEQLPVQCPPADAQPCGGSFYRIVKGIPTGTEDYFSQRRLMMSNTLTMEKLLEFVDVPQLFLARDKFDTQYLCLLYDDEPACKYTAVKISPEQFSLFVQKKTDLRTLYVSPELTGEYFDVEYVEGSYEIAQCPYSVLPEERLPESDYYFDDTDLENITVQVPKKDKPLLLNLLRHRGWVAM